MNYSDFTRVVNEKERGLDMSVAFPSLMRKVYTWMALALVITGIVAYGVASSPAVLTALFGSGSIVPFLVICAAELGLVWYVSSRIMQLSLTTATLLFVIYSALNGLVLSTIFLVYTMSSITQVFFITAGTFAVMSFVGHTTKTDLSKLGGILLMALIGLIIASAVNIFLKSSGLELILSYAGVLIFVGLTAWDSQKIKLMLAQAYDTGETAQKMALLGSLMLYLDFINLFIYLLRIFGRRE